MTPTLVFDIETIPDVAGLRPLHRLPVALADADVRAWAPQRRRMLGDWRMPTSNAR
jgi:predicted PolB exonuclease-like 3'-5' exonuclease